MQAIWNILNERQGLVYPAILLNRPYPPRSITGRSKLGGRPNLPHGLGWPRAKDGTPYHFLAQIVMQELPNIASDLPREGVLFFFARIDEDLSHLSENGQGGAVLHTRSLGNELEPPSDIEAIGGFYGTTFDKHFVLDDAEFSKLYAEWPLIFEHIPTFPEQEKYNWALDELHGQYGLRRQSESDMPWVRAGSAVSNAQSLIPSDYLPFPGLKHEPSFPQLYVMIDRICRYIIKRSDRLKNKTLRQGSLPTPDNHQFLGTTIDQAKRWVQVAANNGVQNCPNKVEQKAFVEWLSRLANDLIEHSL